MKLKITEIETLLCAIYTQADALKGTGGNLGNEIKLELKTLSAVKKKLEKELRRLEKERK